MVLQSVNQETEGFSFKEGSKKNHIRKQRTLKKQQKLESSSFIF